MLPIPITNNDVDDFQKNNFQQKKKVKILIE